MSKTDLISRQSAIDVVKGIDSGFVKYIEDLPSVQQWNVIKKRPMTNDERIEWSERIGYDIDYEEAVIYSNLPDDGEEVLICYKWGHVCIDTFRQEEEGCYFEGGGDMDGVIAWMPLPEPYKGA